VSIIPMGGALEGVCAAGLADAIVDLHETGTSLARNGLRILERVRACQGLFVAHPDQAEGIADLLIRLQAALAARGRRYLLAHLPPGRIGELTELFAGLASPTVLPLAGRDDMVAVHLVIEESSLWTQLRALRGIGASGIVAMPVDAILP
jgi:ATP phosphoribosyltransferase